MGVTVKILSGGREKSSESNSESVAKPEVIPDKPLIVGDIAEKSETTEKLPLFTAPVKVSPRRLGFGAVITSDCHNKSYLDCYYKEARELLLSAGFKTIWKLTDDGFKETEI